MFKKVKRYLLDYTGALVIVLATALGSVGFGTVIQKNPAITKWDNAGYEWFQHIPRNKIIDSVVYPFNFDFLSVSGSKPTFIYFLAGGFVLYMAIRRRKHLARAVVTLLIASGFIWWITQVDWTYISRKRPFLVLPSQVNEFSRKAWQSWSTYPSGHVRETALYSTIIAEFVPEAGAGAAALVMFVAVSRLYLGAHYPTDVIAAAVIGYAAAKAAMKITGKSR